MKKRRLFVICPGRGSYTKESLGYLKTYQNTQRDFLRQIDNQREIIGEVTVSELDHAETFKTSLHTKGEHASPLIYACSYCDFMSIDRDRYEVVAIAGNSMGWYLSLVMGGALNPVSGFKVINTMGSMMKEGLIGGQIIYPLVDDNWQVSAEKVSTVKRAIQFAGLEHQAYYSIYLGGYAILAGDNEAIKKLVEFLPKDGDYPFKLINHGAFHTPLLHEISTRGFDLLPLSLFGKPQIPLIDGRGHIWSPYSTNIEELYYYTLGYQVVEPYDFTASLKVGIKEYNPDHVVLLGPGSSLGGAIGQTFVDMGWHNINSKDDFKRTQKEGARLISMGIPEQAQVLKRQ